MHGKNCVLILQAIVLLSFSGKNEILLEQKKKEYVEEDYHFGWTIPLKESVFLMYVGM